MMKTRSSRSWAVLLLLVCVTIVTFLPTSHAASSSEDDKCTSGTMYKCPNCGGFEVSDCSDCDNYLSSDDEHKMCIDRRLFQKRNTDENDYDNHYHYLWNDLVGMVVWFFTAGVATACGVGGGGIYVPLGILLLQLAPKQSSGLSQASIFGASLGGLFLNSRDTHPNTKIRNQGGGPGHVDGERVVQEPLHDEAVEQAYLESSNGNNTKDTTWYTRPLINYDMALFLAPMEMAGAVLGLLVQKILPNWLYLLIAACVLSFTAYKTYKKFGQARQKEKDAEAAKKQKEAEALQQEDPETAPMDDSDKKKSDNNSDNGSADVTQEAAFGSSADEDSETEKKDETHATTTFGEGEEVDAADGKPPMGKDVSVSSVPLEDKSRLSVVADEPINDTSNNNGSETNEEEMSLLRKHFLEQDQRQYPREKVAGLIILWVGLTIITLMKGGKGVESLVGIDCESPWYAVLIVLQFMWLFGFAVYYGMLLVKFQNERIAVQYPYLHDDPVWNTQSLRFYGFFTFVAGVVAGLIGIGGGMVLGPLMLVMGIHPRVSTATTATMIVLTSSSVAIIAITSGLVPWSYAIFYFFVCLSGAIVGKLKIDGYVKRTGRASLLVFILATIILFATLGIVVILLTRLAEQDWCLDGFNKFCDIEDEEGCPVNRMLNAMGMVGGGENSLQADLGWDAFLASAAAATTTSTSSLP